MGRSCNTTASINPKPMLVIPPLPSHHSRKEGELMRRRRKKKKKQTKKNTLTFTWSCEASHIRLHGYTTGQMAAVLLLLLRCCYCCCCCCHSFLSVMKHSPTGGPGRPALSRGPKWPRPRSDTGFLLLWHQNTRSS